MKISRIHLTSFDTKPKKQPFHSSFRIQKRLQHAVATLLLANNAAFEGELQRRVCLVMLNNFAVGKVAKHITSYEEVFLLLGSVKQKP